MVDSSSENDLGKQMLAGKLPVEPSNITGNAYDVQQNALSAIHREHLAQFSPKELEARKRVYQDQLNYVNTVSPQDELILKETNKELRYRIKTLCSQSGVVEKMKEGLLHYSQLNYREQAYLQTMITLMTEKSIGSKREFIYLMAKLAEFESWEQSSVPSPGIFSGNVHKGEGIITEEMRYAVSVLSGSPRLYSIDNMAKLSSDPIILGKPTNVMHFTQDEVDYGPELNFSKFNTRDRLDVSSLDVLTQY